MNLVDEIEQEYMKETEDIPEFNVGDRVCVHVQIGSGDSDRIQKFEGDVISRKGGGINETFTVRKLIQGQGLEQTFPLHSPRVENIELVRRGKVRRSKLYYLRHREGKSARVQERIQETQSEMQEATESESGSSEASQEETEEQTEKDQEE